MVTISKRAREKLMAGLTGKRSTLAVRIHVTSGWGSPALGLVLDEPKEKDRLFDSDGLKMVVEGTLLEKLGAIQIDYRDTFWQKGFSVTSSQEPEESGLGCC